MDINFKLDLPPPLNACYRPTMRGGHYSIYKSKEAKEWQEYCGLTVNKYLLDHKLEVDLDKKDKFALEVDLYLKRDRDIDSSLKLLLDALEGQIYVNDKQVTELKVKKVKWDEPYIHVYIKEL